MAGWSKVMNVHLEPRESVAQIANFPGGEHYNEVWFEIQCFPLYVLNNYKFYIVNGTIHGLELEEGSEEERELFQSMKDGIPMKIQQQK